MSLRKRIIQPMKSITPSDAFVFSEPTGDIEKFIHWCTNGKKGPMPKLQINPKYKSMFSHHLKEEAFILNTDITDKDLND